MPGSNSPMRHMSYIEEQIRQMANDPDIQTELAGIDRELAVTEPSRNEIA